MATFNYVEAQSLDEAVTLLSQSESAAMGGGTDLLTQVRDGVVAAERLVGPGGDSWNVGHRGDRRTA